MKFRSLLSALLLATGLVFVAGCGKKEEAPAAKAPDAAGAKAVMVDPTDPRSVAENYPVAKEINFEYKGIMQVTAKYTMVYGFGTLKHKGRREFSIHLIMDRAGWWTVAEFEDNWEPKDRLKSK